MDLTLAGRLCLITGATGAIGEAIARRFAQAGATLALTGRREDRLAALAAELPGATALAADLTRDDDLKRLFASLASAPLHALVNAAGIMRDAPLALTRQADLAEQWQVNVEATWACCQRASRLMARQRGGSIVNLASQVGEQGAAGQSAYAATKAAVSGLTRALAAELGPLGIRVNALAPGFIESPLTARYDGAARERLVERTRLRRLGQPDDVAGAALFLASDLSSYVTGQILAVDGGLAL